MARCGAVGGTERGESVAADAATSEEVGATDLPVSTNPDDGETNAVRRTSRVATRERSEVDRRETSNEQRAKRAVSSEQERLSE